MVNWWHSDFAAQSKLYYEVFDTIKLLKSDYSFKKLKKYSFHFYTNLEIFKSEPGLWGLSWNT